MTLSDEVSGAASVSLRPKTWRARRAIRSATACRCASVSPPVDGSGPVVGPAAAILEVRPSIRVLRPPAATGWRTSAPTGMATGSRPAPSASSSAGSSRSAIGRSVVESGTPGRALTRVASRTRASGRRRTMTMWSAPVASASSSTMAPRIASGDTVRDRLDRIRANDSASSRRPTSRAATASRWRIAANPTRTMRPTRTTSIGRRVSSASRSTAMRHRQKNEVAKIHQARRIRRSGGPSGRGVGWVGSLTSGIEDGGPGPSRPSPFLVLKGPCRGVLSSYDARSTGSGWPRPGAPAMSFPPSRFTR